MAEKAVKEDFVNLSKFCAGRKRSTSRTATMPYA